MEAMPNPPKPIEAHKRTGTYNATKHGKRNALVAVEPVTIIGDVTYLDEAADIFRNVMEAGAPWFAVTDAVRLGMLRQSLEERARLLPHAEASTETRRQLRELNKEISEWLSVLGFDPAARARLGLAEVKARSKIEEMQAARDKRTR